MTKLRRSSFSAALRVVICLAAACVFLGGAGTGAADDVTNPNPCPSPDKSKRFCVTVSDTDGLSRSKVNAAPLYMEYTVTVKSTERSRSLTHPSLKATVVDLIPGGTTATSATLVSSTLDPGAQCGPLQADGTISCVLPKLTPGFVWVGRFLMTTSTNAAATATRLTARVSVDEREREQTDPSDPNQEVREAANPTVYAAANAGGTIVPGGIDQHFSVPTSLSSLEFESQGTLAFSAFITDIANDPNRCFTGVTCLKQTSEATVGAGAPLFGPANPIQWIRQILDPPGSVKDYNINAIHGYDPIPVTVNVATDTFTAPKSFVSIDGVRFSTTGTLPAPLQAGVDYFVVSGTPTSFKVSSTAGGAPIVITTAGTGTTSAGRIRIIGDDPTGAERASSCAETLTKVPSIFATELSKTVIQECVSDVENGYMK
jgi:hypothetical protein